MPSKINAQIVTEELFRSRCQQDEIDLNSVNKEPSLKPLRQYFADKIENNRPGEQAEFRSLVQAILDYPIVLSEDIQPEVERYAAEVLGDRLHNIKHVVLDYAGPLHGLIEFGLHADYVEQLRQVIWENTEITILENLSFNEDEDSLFIRGAEDDSGETSEKMKIPITLIFQLLKDNGAFKPNVRKQELAAHLHSLTGYSYRTIDKMLRNKKLQEIKERDDQITPEQVNQAHELLQSLQEQLKAFIDKHSD